MVKIEKAATPAPSSQKKQFSSVGSKNGSILSFFSKKASDGTPRSATGVWKTASEPKGVNVMPKPAASIKKPVFKKATLENSTPVPSSDAAGPPSSQENENGGIPTEVLIVPW